MQQTITGVVLISAASLQECGSILLWESVPGHDKGLDLGGPNPIVVHAHVYRRFVVINVAGGVREKRPGIRFHQFHIRIRHPLECAAMDDRHDKRADGDEQDTDGNGPIQPPEARARRFVVLFRLDVHAPG